MTMESAVTQSQSHTKSETQAKTKLCKNDPCDSVTLDPDKSGELARRRRVRTFLNEGAISPPEGEMSGRTEGGAPPGRRSMSSSAAPYVRPHSVSPDCIAGISAAAGLRSRCRDTVRGSTSPPLW